MDRPIRLALALALALATTGLLACGGSGSPPPQPPPTPVYEPPPQPPPEPPPAEPEIPPAVSELQGILTELAGKVDEILAMRFAAWRGRLGEVRALVDRAQGYEAQVPESAESLQQIGGHFGHVQDAVGTSQRHRAQRHLQHIRDKALAAHDALVPARAAEPATEEPAAEEPAAQWP